MRFPALAISLAALAAVILFAQADAPGRSLATSPPSAQRMSIDMDSTGNTASGLPVGHGFGPSGEHLGTREPCAAMAENNVLDLDEDLVDTVLFDVTITGIPAGYEMIGYAYSLQYPAPQTRIEWDNYNFMIIANPGSGVFRALFDPLPDTDGYYGVTVVDGGPNPASAESGSGVLNRLGIVTNPGATAGLYPLTLTGNAHVDTGGTGRSPDATDNALIQINAGPCGTYVDTEMVSLSLSSANPIPIGSNSAVTAGMTIRNNGPQSANTAATTTFTVPPGCTLNNAGGTVVLNAALGVIPSGSSVGHQETPSLRCTSTVGSFVMPVTACGAAEALDLVSVNDCITQNLNFDVIAPPGTDADSDGVYDLDEFNCGVSTFGAGFFPERLNGSDDDGDTAIDEALPAGSGAYDCDGDGYVGTAEAHVFGAGQDQARCGFGSWPADLATGGVPDSTNRINIGDLVSYIVPTRHLNTNVGDNPGNVRWDIAPGKGVFPTDINVTDLTSLIIVKPPMFSGTRAFNWLACTP